MTLEREAAMFARAARLVKGWRAVSASNAPSLREAAIWCETYTGDEIADAFAEVRAAGRLDTYREFFGGLLRCRRQARGLTAEAETA